MAEPPIVYQMMEEDERRKKAEKKKREDKAKQICDLLLANTLIPKNRYASAYLVILNQLE